MSEHHADPGRHAVTTTDAGWGAGNPRLIISNGHQRYIHELDCDLTYVGSAPDSEVVLPGADPVHATILHDTTDEYVLTMVGQGDTSFRRQMILRTSASFTAGPWSLIFSRDEYADHGRPYGGRRGGEFAHQQSQPTRPDYAKDHPPSSLKRCAIKPPGDTSSAEARHTLGQAALNEGAADASTGEALNFRLVNDNTAGVYEATVGDKIVGGVPYNILGDDRLALLAVSIYPEFRGRGVAMALIRRVLDDIRAQGKTITNHCPVVRTFIENNPDYADLVDASHPGA